MWPTVGQNNVYKIFYRLYLWKIPSLSKLNKSCCFVWRRTRITPIKQLIFDNVPFYVLFSFGLWVQCVEVSRAQHMKIWGRSLGRYGVPSYILVKLSAFSIPWKSRDSCIIRNLLTQGRATPYIWNDEHQHICVKSCVYTAFQVNKIHWLQYVYLIITAAIGWGKNEDKVLKSLRQTPEKINKQTKNKCQSKETFKNCSCYCTYYIIIHICTYMAVTFWQINFSRKK